MDSTDWNALWQVSSEKISRVDCHYHRYLYSQINWNNRLICIKGESGVGKTTLMLQHLAQMNYKSDTVLYVAMDNLWFEKHDLMDLVSYFATHNGQYLFLDEIHHLSNWSVYIKNIYDNYPELHVVYSGSSMLNITTHEADLSRRQRVYNLPAMSFREYLLFQGYEVGEAISLTDILTNHVSIAAHLLPKDVHILPLFEQYLHSGCYPFYKEEGDGYMERIASIIHRVIEVELPCVEDVTYATIRKCLKMLLILSERVPYTPKMAEVYRELETNRDLGLKMLHWLESAGLLHLATYETKTIRTLSKPDKIYLSNPNLMYCLSNKVDIGTLRETFFYSQLNVISDILLAQKGDFYVDRQYLFEIGGKAKNFEQIKDEPNSFLALDEMEIGYGNRIPLWMFGLLY